jgi:Xaa-Pro dipeptidase
MPWNHGDNRGNRIRAALAQHDLDALLALSPENAAYHAGRTSFIAGLWRVPGLSATAVGPEGRVAVAIPDTDFASFSTGDYAAIFPHQLWVEHFDLRAAPAPVDLAAAIAKSRPPGALRRPAQFDLDEVYRNVVAALHSIVDSPDRVGIDLATVPIELHRRLQQQLPSTSLIDASAIFDDLRALKDPDEIEHLRRAAELTVIGIAEAREQLVQGMSELGVNAAFQTAVWRRAASNPRYAAMRQVEGAATVGNGPGGDRTVGPRRTVKFDMQVDVGGYHSDIGRTYAFAPTRQQREVYAALRNALAAAQSRVKPGTPFRDIFQAGTDAMRTAGFSTYSRGHLGHSVGLGHNYEEPPFIAAHEERPIVPALVLSLELPLYLHGIGHFQLERMLLVTESGHEALDNLLFEFEIETS